MIWGICFWLAVVFLAAGTAAFFIRRRRARGEIRYLGAGVFLACVAICFPGMCLSDQEGFALAMSVSHSIRMFVVDTGVSDIADLLSPDTLGIMFYPYKILVCLLYLLAPVFTLSVVLRYFSNYFERLRLTFRRNQDLYIFSDLNSRSLEIAAGLSRGMKSRAKKQGIIFCRSSEKDNINTELEEKARELNAVFAAGDMLQLRLNNKRRYTAYFHISADDEINIDDTLQMIDNMTGDSPWLKSGKLNQENTAIYCYSSNTEAEILLDAREKENLRVVLMNEMRDAVYEHLYRYPLYSGIRMPEAEQQGEEKQDRKEKGGRKSLPLLIVGGGKTGIEFLKAALWCGQMKDYEPDIHLIDIKGNLIRKKIEEECPELFKEQAGYKIDIHKVNIFSSMAERYLDTLPGISYCVVCLGEDEDNIRAAMWLKKYFYMKGGTRSPLISAYIESSRKRAAVWNMHENTRSKEILYYGIIPFGSREMYFGNRSEAAFVMEYLALGVQAHYWRLKRESGDEERKNAIKNFYEKQSNRRSSIASGLHIGSKLWEMGLGIMRVPAAGIEKEMFGRYIHPVDFAAETAGKLEAYYNLEHERWMTYIRTEGWRLATKGGDSLEDIRKCYEEYCAEFKNQNYMMKLHPALVPIEKTKPEIAVLREVEDMMADVTRRKGFGEWTPDYVQSDAEVVNHIGDIVGGVWCGAGGISIHGIPAKEGECVICRLSDMMEYYGRMYRERKKEGSPEEIITLRETVRRCCYGVIRTAQSGGKEPAYQWLKKIV